MRLAAGTLTTEPPPLDAYSLRLVVGRKLYDHGVARRSARRRWPASPPRRVLHVNPHDLDRLGVAAGSRVKVTSSRDDARSC